MIYFNCQALIIGFELNVGIMAARRKNEQQNNGAAENAIETTLQQPLSHGPEFNGNKNQ